jgi:hypothetical protein
MSTSRESDYAPQPYAPTPDGFERRLRIWIRLPADDVLIPDTGRRVYPQKSMARLGMRQCSASARLGRSGT